MNIGSSGKNIETNSRKLFQVLKFWRKFLKACSVLASSKYIVLSGPGSFPAELYNLR